MSRATIATATPLCLGPRKGRRRNRSSRSNKPQDHTQKRQAQMDELRKLLEEKTGTDNSRSNESEQEPPKLAPTTKTWGSGKPPYLSPQESHEELKKLWLETETHVSKINPMSLSWINRESIRVREGGLSAFEERQYIRRALEGVEHGEKVRIEQVLRWWKEEDFQERFQKEMQRVNKATQDKMLESLKYQPPHDEVPLSIRLEDIWFAEIQPFVKREYLEKKVELLGARKSSWFEIRPSEGPSMLTTMRRTCRTINMPISLDNAGKVWVGHVVTFINLSNDGNIRSVGKRIRGLAGDVADYQGRKVVVPEGHFWAVGDNEAQSHDSRHYGAVKSAFLSLSRGIISSKHDVARTRVAEGSIESSSSNLIGINKRR